MIRVMCCLLVTVLMVGCASGQRSEKARQQAEANQREILANPKVSFERFAARLHEVLRENPSHLSDADGGYGLARRLTIQVGTGDVSCLMGETVEEGATLRAGIMSFSAVLSGDTDKGKAEYPLDQVSLYCIPKSGRWGFSNLEYKSSEWFSTGDAKSIVAMAVTREDWVDWVKAGIGKVYK